MSLNIQDPDRGTGRTTRRAIAYVHLLINRAGEKVFIRDHADAKNGHDGLVKGVCKILDVLNVTYSADLNDFSIIVKPLVKSGELPDV